MVAQLAQRRMAWMGLAELAQLAQLGQLVERRISSVPDGCGG